MNPLPKPTLLALTLALAACAAPVPSTDAGPPQRFLVLGEVQSPVYDALRQRGQNSFTTFKGESIQGFDGLILDGDAHSPDTLANQTLIGQAFKAGKWVLALDVNENHKAQAFKPQVLVSSEGTSNAYLMAQGSIGGHSANFVFDDRPGTTGSDDGLSAQGLKPMAVDAQTTARHLEAVMAQQPFGNPSLRALEVGASQDPDAIPPNVPAFYNTYVTNSPRTLSDFYDLLLSRGNIPTTQTATAYVAYHFWVLANQAPGRHFQYIAFDIDGQFDPGPLNFTRGTISYEDDGAIPYAQGYYQDAAGISVRPLTAGLLQGGVSPRTADGTSEFKSALRFDVEAPAVPNRGPSTGGSRAFVYQSFSVNDLGDWMVEDASVEGGQSWRYSSRTKIDGTLEGIKKYPKDSGEDDPHGGNVLSVAKCPNGFFTKVTVGATTYPMIGVFARPECYPNDTNTLNVSPLSVRPQGYWRTDLGDPAGNNLMNGEARFELRSQHHMSLVKRDGPKSILTVRNAMLYHKGLNFSTTNTLHVDMGATLPRAVQSVTLSGDGQTMRDDAITVRGGSQVQGTLTLAAPVKIKTHVFPVLEGSQINAITAPDVLVLNPGESSVSFQMQTQPVLQASTLTLKFVYGDFAGAYQVNLTP